MGPQLCGDSGWPRGGKTPRRETHARRGLRIVIIIIIMIMIMIMITVIVIVTVIVLVKVIVIVIVIVSETHAPPAAAVGRLGRPGGDSTPGGGCE